VFPLIPRFSMFFIASGVELSPLYCGHFWPIVPAPDDRWGWLWSNWWNEDWQGKPKYLEKTCPSVTLSTTNPTWPDTESNPDRRDGKPATNRLSYDAAYEVVSWIVKWPCPGTPRRFYIFMEFLTSGKGIALLLKSSYFKLCSVERLWTGVTETSLAEFIILHLHSPRKTEEKYCHVLFSDCWLDLFHSYTQLVTASNTTLSLKLQVH
jgi:hypothetical protein